MNTHINAENIDIDKILYIERFKKVMGAKTLDIEIGEREVSIDLINFIDKCLKWNHQDRASIQELLAHPFIQRE